MSVDKEKALLQEEKSEIKWMDKVSDFLDSRYKIPFTDIRFGADFVIGLIPTVGDFFSFALSGTLIIAMARHGVSAWVLLRMIGNLVLDVLVGAIPIIGDIFDLAYKANRRNFNMLQKYYERDKTPNNPVLAVIIVIIVLVAILVLLAWLMWNALAWIFG